LCTWIRRVSPVVAAVIVLLLLLLLLEALLASRSGEVACQQLRLD